MDELLSELRRLRLKNPEAAAESILDLHGLARKADQSSEDWKLFEGFELAARERAEAFRKAASANNPFDVLRAKSRQLLTMVKARMRRRVVPRIDRKETWSALELSPDGWAALDEDKQYRVRKACEGLAEYYDQIAPRRGRPQKDPLDTLILALAEIFARHTDFPNSIFALPVNEKSRFVQFAELAFRSSEFDPSERSRLAISRRWRRLARPDQRK